MQIIFRDLRTPGMSAKQQMENVFVDKVEMVTDVDLQMKKTGIGCYMCTKPMHETLEKTLAMEPNWNRQLGKECYIRGGKMVPYMRSNNMFGKGPEDFNIDHLQLDLPAGVYILHPYMDKIQSANDKSDDGKPEYRLLTEQLDKYLDPDYAIRIEITGMEKTQ